VLYAACGFDVPTEAQAGLELDLSLGGWAGPEQQRDA